MEEVGGDYRSCWNCGDFYGNLVEIVGKIEDSMEAGGDLVETGRKLDGIWTGV
jgi:hypothetical protein